MMLPYAAPPILLAGAAMYYSPYLWRHLQAASIRKKLAERRTLALTYDDGPSESLTPKILDILRSYNAAATFFMLGCNAKKHPDLANQILEQGHEIGCHSDQHLNAWKVTPRRAIADIDAGYETLSPWVRSNGAFRPPYGKITLSTYRAIRKRGARISWWTIDSGDTKVPLPSPDDVASRVVRDRGGIVLLHDLGGSKAREDFICDTTVLLLEVARRKSLTIKRMSDLVA